MYVGELYKNPYTVHSTPIKTVGQEEKCPEVVLAHGILCSTERKKGLLPFATAWMELESIMLHEISQAVRDKYHMISPLTGKKERKKKANKI